MPIPTVSGSQVAWITSAQMVEIDRIMIEDMGITLLQMMENAGRSLADLTLELFAPRSVSILAGSGGNGGGGLTAGRHLHNLGVDVTVSLSSDRLGEAAVHQANTLRQMGVPFSAEPDLETDLVIDAMVGYSLTGALRGRAKEWTSALPGSVPVLSLDVPSGLDTSGAVGASGVKATATMTLCLPKVGLKNAVATGNLYLADISVPAAVVARVAQAPAPPFELGRILRIDR
jgi:NAD(P)H-hydrate epimerase